MTRAPCTGCGRPGVHEHHLTLRDEHGRRLDEDLVVWLCKACHLGEHNTLRILELERAVGPLTVVERVELRLRRVAAFLVRLGVPFRVLCGPLGVAMSRWADDLAGHTRGLDLRFPNWRDQLD
ncbi:MAG: hypothetical protein ACRDQZ_06665 [Mycobacteriales bacterium]